MRRPGFALIATLWVLVGVSALTVGVLLVARQTVAVARNRVALARARWRADDCLERGRSVIADVLSGRDGGPGDVRASWSTLDRAIAASPILNVSDCELRMSATGATVDVNAADSAQLDRLFRAMRLGVTRASAVAHAVSLWRQHGTVSNVQEIRRIAHLDEEELADTALLRVLSADDGRIVWDRAPAEVLASLPGVTPNVRLLIAAWQASGKHIADVFTLSPELLTGDRDSLFAHYAELARLTVSEPAAWRLVAVGHAEGFPAVTAIVEVLIQNAGGRAAIARRRLL